MFIMIAVLRFLSSRRPRRLISDELLDGGVSQHALCLEMFDPHPQLRPKPLSRALPQPSHRPAWRPPGIAMVEGNGAEASRVGRHLPTGCSTGLHGKPKGRPRPLISRQTRPQRGALLSPIREATGQGRACRVLLVPAKLPTGGHRGLEAVGRLEEYLGEKFLQAPVPLRALFKHFSH
jgi:hypothetical protein